MLDDMAKTDEIDDARESLILAFVRMLDVASADPASVDDRAVIAAADTLDDANGQLVAALRNARRHGTAADRAPDA